MNTTSLQHLTNVATRQGRVIRRRDFLRNIAAASLAAGSWSWTDAIAASADQMRSQGMACILLWMQGGPSQFETFSPKPNHDNGGETKAIGTSVSGIQIAENLPYCARVMDDLAIVRSMTSKEGNHQRATYLLHHGYLPMGGVNFPSLGSNVAHQIGNAANQLPNFVRIGGRLANSGGGGFLGVDYDPLVLRSANRPPDNTKPLSDSGRYHRRLRLLDSLENTFAVSGGSEIVADHRKLVESASDMIMSPGMDAFDLEKEPASLRESYGQGEFAAGCMMARRLVEQGVTFVEVVSNGWDTHLDGFNRTRELTGQIDQPMAALIGDLKQRGMLDKTLVVWLGEFGRTPKINPRAGRDHFPRAFNAVLAGGGVRGGQVIGATNDAGTKVTERPVLITDFFRSIYHTLNIDPDEENISRVGRPIKLVDGGEVITELFG
ncbi:DUF1501 domain-containing protein [Bythopirellula polymerisocia]|uniref:DUF1501 domain-containing protein n=1 Tax=Bythopirellula polymerisocia TaxID=2528003 RepID=A0A5C6D289_9BACT|nr:DUF1501 domain-containing protein [Bythopirellula polymerisocia]TWU29964.1 hypothetical protein Pla144_07450 [Bythopirellula polymerisocia]